ncbi:MAG: KpsF/GutQ family sugar-phosphate isomerase [Bacteroidetes bacterium]|nr:KpsF/GutQ family sugar-phosphate isomerase [Bacteroidota bacterium]MDA0888973.1 KpsF/GutQ family sugar-phosphate isomerase [Bacteroidota bacterium]MDA1084766.1 KpsF/GutQ family sugar-phosphate isomerase [Bacteroidota bacterium]
MTHTAKAVIAQQAAAIEGLIPQITSDFDQVVRWVHHSNGRLVVTGIGKSAIIGMKISATLNSTGTKSMFMHAADAIHGDLGMIDTDDIVICLSKSGATPEIKTLVPLLKNRGNKLVGMTAEADSFLAMQSDAVLHVKVPSEADPNNLAPTTSTTAQLVMGDALAICLMELNGFKAEDFARSHPGGALGKALHVQLLHLLKEHKKPVVQQDTPIADVISEISAKLVGATAVLEEEKIIGVITDGDLRRMMGDNRNYSSLKAKDIMSKSPVLLPDSTLAKEALNLMQQKEISQIIVTQNDAYRGIVHIHDILNEGIY